MRICVQFFLLLVDTNGNGSWALVVPCTDVLQHGWSVDPDSRMLTVKKQPVVKEQKIDPNKLQRLTEYVFHLEH